MALDQGCCKTILPEQKSAWLQKQKPQPPQEKLTL
jgi:hypothetical protein